LLIICFLLYDFKISDSQTLVFFFLQYFYYAAVLHANVLWIIGENKRSRKQDFPCLRILAMFLISEFGFELSEFKKVFSFSIPI